MFVPVGNVRCHLRNHETGEVREWSQSNTFTSGGLTLLRDYLLQSDPAIAPRPPSFIAAGSGTITDTGYYLTALPHEVHRTAIVQREAEGLSVIYHAYFEPQDANGRDFGTWGLFARDASDDAGTGTLVALTNNQNPFQKTAAMSFSADWVITISGRMGTT